MNSRVELNLARLASNVAKLRKVIGDETEIIFVVKANAYGHGVKHVAECAWGSGVRWFAVAHVREAVELRRILPDARILVIGAILPNEVGKCVEGAFIPVITDLAHAREIARALKVAGKTLICHAKIDTGMGRMGIAWEDAVPVLQAIISEKSIDLRGLCTHFASADSDSREYFDLQRARFSKVLDALHAAGIKPEFLHASNSGAIVLEPAIDMDGVRPGIMLYGYARSKGARCLDMQPILQWKTRAVQVKNVPAGFHVSYDSTYMTSEETCIVTIDVGYSDGYPRALSNKGIVLIGGRRLPVVGRVTMNLATVDAGKGSAIKVGDEVVLLGKQGDESLWADEVASMCGTISYEILTNIRACIVEVVS